MSIQSELRGIEQTLRNSQNEWRWHVAQVIASVPSGRLATYGRIADIANRQYGLNVNARNVAWFRRYLYGLLTHNTAVPLHRIAKSGDINSLHDSDTTKQYNDRLRSSEGSLTNPIWI